MLPELLADLEITGFAGGINQTRSTLPFAYPGALAWESPGGGSVLAWRGEHYMFANMVGFRESVGKVLEKLPGYLVSLEKRGYPHEVALLQMAGYFTDNAAPSHRASDLVKEWNERFAVPEVRLATLSEFFDALRAEGRPAPALRQAWPDWWADGVGSAALEASVIRGAQEKLGFAEAFLCLARAVRSEAPDLRAAFDEAYLLASLYDEHTFGASDSIASPGSINSKTQWAEKATHAHRASWLATQLEAAALAALAEDAAPRGEHGVVVFNGLAWERSGPVRVRVPRSIAEEGTVFRILDAGTNEELPYQQAGAAPNYRDFEIVAHGVPSLGFKVYRLEVGAAPALCQEVFEAVGSRLANGLVRVELNPARAAIASIRSAGSAAGQENLVDVQAEHGFNQYLHESIVHDKGRWHLWPPVAYEAKSFQTVAAGPGKLEAGASGPVRRSLRLQVKVPSARGDIAVDTEVSLYRGLGEVYIENRVTRPASTDPEASYFAFPFAAPGPPRADIAGGVMEPGRDQIPGSASDWHALQRWVRFAGGGRDAVLAIVDAPLVQFGGLNTGRWGKGLRLDRPLVYSWVMNNYWFTNFLASQQGDFSFRYAVAGGEAAASDAAADRFAREVCSPLKALVVPGRGESPPRRRSFLAVEPPEVDVVALKEADAEPGNLVVRLRNRSDRPVKAAVRLDAAIEVCAAVTASVVEEARDSAPLVDGEPRVELGPWGLATLILRR
jgi:hypothetical protein